MRRNGIFRSLAGIFAVWLAICMAEPAQLHTCPMHGQLAIGAHDAGSHHAASHDAAAHALAGHSHDRQDSDGKAKQCSCLGDCSAGRTLVGIAAASTSFASAPVSIPAVFSSYASPEIVAPHFLLPFSNGPPDTSSRA